MRILIVEDEITATKKLESLLKRVNPQAEIVARLESVKETVLWIKQNPHPDIAYFDVQLADDISFEIFRQCDITFPVVFVTAFDSYLLEAFNHNTVHYLSKPVTESEVRESLEKLKRIAEHFGATVPASKPKDARNMILVRKGMDYVPIDADKIAYAFSEHKVSFARDHDGIVYIANHSLTELENRLNPEKFFRANRQYLVNLNAIEKYRSIEQSKIKLELTPAAREDVIIGKENAGLFRKWIKEKVKLA